MGATLAPLPPPMQIKQSKMPNGMAVYEMEGVQWYAVSKGTAKKQSAGMLPALKGSMLLLFPWRGRKSTNTGRKCPEVEPPVVCFLSSPAPQKQPSLPALQQGRCKEKKDPPVSH